MRWDEMSMSQKSEAIGLMVRNGVTDIGTMKQMWDDMDGWKSPQQPPFAKRFEENPPRTIPTSQGNATHFMAADEAKGRYFAYPTVQPIDYKNDRSPLKYYGDRALDRALENNDVMEFKTLEDAIKYSENYKRPPSTGAYLNNEFHPLYSPYDYVRSFAEGGRFNDIQTYHRDNLSQFGLPYQNDKPFMFDNNNNRKLYEVAAGDSLWRIANNNNITIDELRELNPSIRDTNLIHPKDFLVLPEKESDISNKYTNGERQNLKARRLLEEQANRDNLSAIQAVKHNDNYVVIDKKNHLLTVFDKDNNPIYSTNEIATGLAGTDYNTITRTDNGKLINYGGNNSTPAGISVISGQGTYHDLPSYTRSRKGQGDDIASSLHFGKVEKDKAHASNGCVRISEQGLKNLSNYLKKGVEIFTLPEKEGSRFVVKDGKLSFTADNPYGEQDGDKRYWDDYNVYIDKSYGELFISPNKNLDKSWSMNATKYAAGITENKKQLQKDLKIDSGTFNRLAELAMGIAGQESKFGNSNKYKIKESSQGLVSFVKDIKGNDSANSRGLTQIKYKADIKNKELKALYDKYKITEENLTDPRKAAIATILRLCFIYNTEILGRDFKGSQGVKIDPYDALLYKYQGKRNELSNQSATPNDNIYIRNVKDYANKFDYEGVFANGGSIDDPPDKKPAIPVGGYMPDYYPSQQEWLRNWFRNREEQVNDNFKGIAIGVNGFDPSRSIPVQYVERAIDGSMKAPVKYQSIFNDPDNPTSSYNRDTGQIFIDPNMQDIESTLLHERTHALNHQLPQRVVGQQGYEMSPIESKVRDVMMPWYKENKQDLDEYWDDPVEIYARMMQMRYRLNLDPTKKVSKDDLKKWRKDGLLRQYEMGVYDDDTLLQLFNEVADNRQLQNNQRNTYVIPTDIGLGYV